MSSVDTLTQIAWEWGLRCFGSSHMTDKPMRALRLAEECVEYAQTTGLPKEQLHTLIEVVYSRPVGDPLQELGGVMVCAAVCGKNQLGLSNMEQVFEAEVRRVLAKSPEDFAKRNEEKVALGLNAKTYGSDLASLMKLAQRAFDYNLQHRSASVLLMIEPPGVVIHFRRSLPFRDIKSLVSWEEITYAKFDILDQKFTDLEREFARGNEKQA